MVSNGIDAIIAFYSAVWVKFHGYQWALDTTRWLGGDIALNYEHARSPPLGRGPTGQRMGSGPGRTGYECRPERHPLPDE